jgi:hypothetical protein
MYFSLDPINYEHIDLPLVNFSILFMHVCSLQIFIFSTDSHKKYEMEKGKKMLKNKLLFLLFPTFVSSSINSNEKKKFFYSKYIALL